MVVLRCSSTVCFPNITISFGIWQFSLSRKAGNALPGQKTQLNIDLGNQKATVSLLAVDKAIYGLNSPNKLTSKQVVLLRDCICHCSVL